MSNNKNITQSAICVLPFYIYTECQAWRNREYFECRIKHCKKENNIKKIMKLNRCKDVLVESSFTYIFSRSI